MNEEELQIRKHYQELIDNDFEVTTTNGGHLGEDAFYAYYLLGKKVTISRMRSSGEMAVYRDMNIGYAWWS